MNISHLEKLYIENRDYIDNASEEELINLINTPLYIEIFSNANIDDSDIKTCPKVLEIISLYKKKKVLSLNKKSS